MYEKILVCLDNSEDACAGVDVALAIAEKTAARVTGCHVYAARLHDERFRQMESGLPEKYQNEEELKRQRETHDTLIDKGLRIISDSYMSVLASRAQGRGVEVSEVSREGKNYAEIVREAAEGRYDLVVLGALGLGKVERSRIGTVCERVVRRLSTDVLVARARGGGRRAKIAVAVDGSPRSFGALAAALELAPRLGASVEAVSAFDPDFHYTAFNSIATVLSDEAGKVFKFKEQEKLHEEIIDKGLAKIYRDHLDTAERMASRAGTEISTVLLSGKAFDELVSYAERERPLMMVMGKTGFHADGGLDIGGNTENCLRELPCHLLITSREVTAGDGGEKEVEQLLWTDDAIDMLGRVPPFVRGVVKNLVEETARKEGLRKVTAPFMERVRKRMKM
ncbi:MAG TPA: hypothetical protein ENJ37_01055 [Deltaproteobacteria bacterium]|nr:hypothetical protein [Deltaproteobacteria bacterium]